MQIRRLRLASPQNPTQTAIPSSPLPVSHAQKGYTFPRRRFTPPLPVSHAQKGYPFPRRRFTPPFGTPNQSLPCAATSTATAAAGDPPPLATIARPAALPTARLLLRGRMASSASAAALLPLPLPSSSSFSSEDSDDAKPLLPPPAPERTSPTPQEEQRRRRRHLERDYNVAMKALARAGDVDQVLALFAELRRSFSGYGGGAHPSVLCYNTLFNALVEAGRVGEALKALGEMRAAGVALNMSSLNILVKLHAWRCTRFDLAYEAIIEMRKLGLEADVGTYSTLITGLCRAGEFREAWGVLDWMLERDCRPMVHTYTPIVQGYCREGRVEEAKEVMALMERAGCPPNVVTYNVLIRALCDDARFDEVEQVLSESRTKGCKPSTVTYNTYMNGLCKFGMTEEALEQLDVMLGEGLDPTDFTLSILLNCLCHDSVSDAICLLERSAELKCYAGVGAYNTVMSKLCKLGMWRDVPKLLTCMIKKDIMPNTRTFNILIRSLCIGEKPSIAKRLVHSQGFAANVVTYNTLIQGFYYCRKVSEVEHLISDMKVENIAQDEVTYTIRVDGLCREGKFDKAADCFLESLESGLSRDLLSFLIKRLAHSDRIWETFRVFEGIERKKILLDYDIFDLTIRSFCRAGFCHDRHICNLNLILDTMLGRK